MNDRSRLPTAFARDYLVWLCGGHRGRKKVRTKSVERHASDVRALQATMQRLGGPYSLKKRGVGHEARSLRRATGTTLDLRSPSPNSSKQPPAIASPPP